MKLQKKVRLSKYTTFKIGGIAKYFVNVKTKEDLKKAVDFAKKKKLPVFILGEGSDILISDKSFKAVVVKLNNKEIEIKNQEVTSGAGVIWDDLVNFCVKKNFQGIECLSGIPGTVGAAPVQNIGAYGQELKETLVRVKVYDIEKEKFIFLNNASCNFSYRESIFKDKKFKKYIIFEVVLKLRKNGLPKVNYESLKKYLLENKITDANIKDIRNFVLKIRSEKLEDPKITPNAGSFFKNPIVSLKKFKTIQNKFPEIPNFPYHNKVKLFAGWLIEKSGWKGKKLGNVGVSNQNALVLVNLGGGRAMEIKNLSEKITDDVYNKFGIKLEREVQFVNF